MIIVSDINWNTITLTNGAYDIELALSSNNQWSVLVIIDGKKQNLNGVDPLVTLFKLLIKCGLHIDVDPDVSKAVDQVLNWAKANSSKANHDKRRRINLASRS